MVACVIPLPFNGICFILFLATELDSAGTYENYLALQIALGIIKRCFCRCPPIVSMCNSRDPFPELLTNLVSLFSLIFETFYTVFICIFISLVPIELQCEELAAKMCSSEDIISLPFKVQKKKIV